MNNIARGFLATSMIVGAGAVGSWYLSAGADAASGPSRVQKTVVLHRHAGAIVDVYKTLDSVPSFDPSTVDPRLQFNAAQGVSFYSEGVRVNLAGDVKALTQIIANDGRTTYLDCYSEYHAEQETKSYEELYGARDRACLGLFGSK